MSTWLQTAGAIYLPPSKPTARVLHTDEFVRPTSLYFHASTDRLLIVGNPHFDVYDESQDDPKPILIPKVSACQYRVFRLQLPDPNRFALVDRDIYDPDKERLVWKLTGIEIDRGGPLGIGALGNPLFNKYLDVENPSAYPQEDRNKDLRVVVGFDPKQTQMFIVGSSPPIGKYWDFADCKTQVENGKCPPINLYHSFIQDGEMGDTGYGAANFGNFQQDKANIPLALVNETAKYPDFVKMSKDTYGNNMFFFGNREQMYARHVFAPAGSTGDPLPLKGMYIAPEDDSPQQTLGPTTYYTTPSGSLVSSDTNLFNKPYWLQRAQGLNNGVCWNNELFVTVYDNTRNVNFNISIYKENGSPDENTKYKYEDYKQYQRHCEEYEVEIVVQLCVVALEPDTLAHLSVMDARILEGWQLSFIPPAPPGIEDRYRYVQSQAIKCPNQPAPQPADNTPTDPYADLTFWKVDLTERFTSELYDTPLGRKFLYQHGLLNGSSTVRSVLTPRKRARTLKRKRGAK